MLTINQRDILAGLIADRFVVPGEPTSKWIKEFERARKEIEEYEIVQENEKKYI